MSNSDMLYYNTSFVNLNKNQVNETNISVWRAHIDSFAESDTDKRKLSGKLTPGIELNKIESGISSGN